ncbi:MAG TPA: molybdopterin molybdotransferase MoeA [Bacteroidia bacterium]|nr:molybdopterin molybdotransferase MoeA [Bacteroidia bacterium]
MIPVSKAKELVLEKCVSVGTEIIPLYEAVERVSVNDLFAPIDTPPFDQSAMDGYAILYKDLEQFSSFRLLQEIPAGTHLSLQHLPGSTLRIFTGAPVPDGYDTVVPQENVKQAGRNVVITNPPLKPGQHVRPRASQSRQGDLALKAGTCLNPGALAYLASLGFDRLEVFRLPKISLIMTGNEIQRPGTRLQAGHIYESNSYGLSAVLKQFGIAPEAIHFVPDIESTIRDAIEKALAQSDVLILSGGVSVGDYDLVVPALKASGVKEVFHKVKQKPGKPLFFGTHDKKLVFALPGNPAAVLTCYYQYILPALKKFTGYPEPYQNCMHLPISSGYAKKPGLTHFLKARAQDHFVLPLEGQESYLMNTFALANCLIELEEDCTEVKKGELVKVHFFQA